MKLLLAILLLCSLICNVYGFEQAFPYSMKNPVNYILTNTKFAGIQMGDKYYLIQDGVSTISVYTASEFISVARNPQVISQIPLCTQPLTCSSSFVNVGMQIFNDKIYFFTSDSPTTFYQCTSTQCVFYQGTNTILIQESGDGSLAFGTQNNRIYFRNNAFKLLYLQFGTVDFTFPPASVIDSGLVSNTAISIDTVQGRVLMAAGGALSQYNTTGFGLIQAGVTFQYKIYKAIADNTRNCYYILAVTSDDKILYLLSIKYSDSSITKSIKIVDFSTGSELVSQYQFWIANDELQGQLIILKWKIGAYGSDYYTYDTTQWNFEDTGNVGNPQQYGLLQLVRFANPLQKHKHFLIFPFISTSTYFGNVSAQFYSSFCTDNCYDGRGYCVNLQCVCYYGYGGNSCGDVLIKITSVVGPKIGFQGNVTVTGAYLDGPNPDVKIGTTKCTVLEANSTTLICKPVTYPGYTSGGYTLTIKTCESCTASSPFQYTIPTISSVAQQNDSVVVSFSNFPNTASLSSFINNAAVPTANIDATDLPNSVKLRLSPKTNVAISITITTALFSFPAYTDFKLNPIITYMEPDSLLFVPTDVKVYGNFLAATGTITIGNNEISLSSNLNNNSAIQYFEFTSTLIIAQNQSLFVNTNTKNTNLLSFIYNEPEFIATTQSGKVLTLETKFAGTNQSYFSVSATNISQAEIQLNISDIDEISQDYLNIKVPIPLEIIPGLLTLSIGSKNIEKQINIAPVIDSITPAYLNSSGDTITIKGSFLYSENNYIIKYKNNQELDLECLDSEQVNTIILCTVGKGIGKVTIYSTSPASADYDEAISNSIELTYGKAPVQPDDSDSVNSSNLLSFSYALCILLLLSAALII